MRAAVGADDHPEYDGPLILCLARFFGVFGVGIVDHSGSADASADPINSPTIPPTMTRAHARAAARSDSCAVPRSDAQLPPFSFDGGDRIRESGSPRFAVCGSLRSGGPTTVGSAASFGLSLRMTMAGGVICSLAKPRRAAFRCGHLVAIAATTASAGFGFGGRKRVVARADQRDDFLLYLLGMTREPHARSEHDGDCSGVQHSRYHEIRAVDRIAAIARAEQRWQNLLIRFKSRRACGDSDRVVVRGAARRKAPTSAPRPPGVRAEDVNGISGWAFRAVCWRPAGVRLPWSRVAQHVGRLAAANPARCRVLRKSAACSSVLSHTVPQIFERSKLQLLDCAFVALQLEGNVADAALIEEAPHHDQLLIRRQLLEQLRQHHPAFSTVLRTGFLEIAIRNLRMPRASLPAIGDGVRGNTQTSQAMNGVPRHSNCARLGQCLVKDLSGQILGFGAIEDARRNERVDPIEIVLSRARQSAGDRAGRLR